MLSRSRSRARDRNQAQASTATRVKGRQPTSIENSDDLFDWLWSQLRALEPKVAVNTRIDVPLEELFHIILSKDDESFIPISWPLIFSNIRWESPNLRTGPRYSLNLLMAVGRMSEELRGYQRRGLSTFVACEIMLQQWDIRGIFIHRTSSVDDAFLVSSADCEQKFGIRVRVKIEDILFDDFELDPYDPSLENPTF